MFFYINIATVLGLQLYYWQDITGVLPDGHLFSLQFYTLKFEVNYQLRIK